MAPNENCFFKLFSRKPLNIYTEFIPQILFLSCLFGYLALLMFIKWAKYFANANPETFALSERCAPSILITFINMVLFRANEAEPGCEPYLYAGQLGASHVSKSLSAHQQLCASM
jgi:V-type H+-transporting ATPase subunit a